jgi:hypothetical protein
MFWLKFVLNASETYCCCGRVHHAHQHLNLSFLEIKFMLTYFTWTAILKGTWRSRDDLTRRLMNLRALSSKVAFDSLTAQGCEHPRANEQCRECDITTSSEIWRYNRQQRIASSNTTKQKLATSRPRPSYSTLDVESYEIRLLKLHRNEENPMVSYFLKRSPCSIQARIRLYLTAEAIQTSESRF